MTKQIKNQSDMFNNTMTTIVDYYNKIPNIVIIYLALCLGHFIAANIYPYICCNMSFFGFIISPFMTLAPHCQALRWIIDYTANQLKNYWIFLGTFFIGYIVKRFQLTNDK